MNTKSSMNASKVAKPAAILAMLALYLIFRPSIASAQAQTPNSVPEKTDALTTTEKDQIEVSVTVYNSNIALVRDVRQIRLAPRNLSATFRRCRGLDQSCNGAFSLADR